MSESGVEDEVEEIPHCIALVKYANVVLSDGGRNDESPFHILQHPHQVISLSEGWRSLCAVLRGCGPTVRSTMAAATGTPSYGGSCGQERSGSQLAQRHYQSGLRSYQISEGSNNGIDCLLLAQAARSTAV